MARSCDSHHVTRQQTNPQGPHKLPTIMSSKLRSLNLLTWLICISSKFCLVLDLVTVWELLACWPMTQTHTKSYICLPCQILPCQNSPNPQVGGWLIQLPERTRGRPLGRLRVRIHSIEKTWSLKFYPAAQNFHEPHVVSEYAHF